MCGLKSSFVSSHCLQSTTIFVNSILPHTTCAYHLLCNLSVKACHGVMFLRTTLPLQKPRSIEYAMERPFASCMTLETQALPSIRTLRFRSSARAPKYYNYVSESMPIDAHYVYV